LYGDTSGKKIFTTLAMNPDRKRKSFMRLRCSQIFLKKNTEGSTFSNHYSEVRTEIFVQTMVFHTKTIFISRQSANEVLEKEWRERRLNTLYLDIIPFLDEFRPVDKHVFS
jgi:hypothetical protein